VIADAIENGLWASKMDQVFEDCGVFIDWCSLYQENGGPPGRTREQYVSFKRALQKTMDLWYAHQMTSVLFVTTMPDSFASLEGTKAEVIPYVDRGWPAFERRSAQLIKRIKSFGSSGWNMCVDVAAVRPVGGGAAHGAQTPPLPLRRGVSHSVAASRQVPFAPQAFKELLELKTFTNGTDKAVVARLYEKTTAAVLSSVTDLVWDHIAVQPGEGARLGETLGFCEQLERLSMRSMGLDDEELVSLASALSYGALPRLKELALQDNACGDDAAQALASLLHRGCMPQLTTLTLARNAPISAVGRAALKAAASTRQGLKVQLPEDLSRFSRASASEPKRASVASRTSTVLDSTRASIGHS